MAAAAAAAAGGSGRVKLARYGGKIGGDVALIAATGATAVATLISSPVRHV